MAMHIRDASTWEAMEGKAAVYLCLNNEFEVNSGYLSTDRPSLKITKWAGEMARMIKCLPYKHEDLCSQH